LAAVSVTRGISGKTGGAAIAPADPLFPALRASVAHLHRLRFPAWGLAFRELRPDELGDAALGWELSAADSVRVLYLLGADAPYGIPTVRVISPGEARTHWVHVESDGTMCLLPPGQNAMPLLHGVAIDYVLGALLQIIDLNLRGLAGQDPVGARHRWVDAGAHAWSLLAPDCGDREAVAVRIDDRWVIASTRQDLEPWLKHRGVTAGDVVAVLVEQLSDFTNLPRDLQSLGTSHRDMVENGGMVAFVVPSPAGPLIVAVHLGPPGVLTRVRVDRADRQWLHERGGSGLAAATANAHVAIVGCGSLGGGVAALLAHAGVGRLTLIDPDVLSWDNVARHVLGAAAVGRPKAVELARYLRAQVPTIATVTPCSKTWQQVAAVDAAVLRADVIVSTIAAWPGELALAEWARVRGIPLVLGWVESHAAAGHAVSLQGRCLACQFTPPGQFKREVAKWEHATPIRLADGCHEHFLPYGYANIVPTQSMIARLALEVVNKESVEPTHRALLPSTEILRGVGARPSFDCVMQQDGAPATVSWAEHCRAWPPDPNCWHCGGAR
jgi:hypothetical protein